MIAHALIIASGTAIGLLVRESFDDKESGKTYALCATTLVYFAFKLFEKFLGTPFYLYVDQRKAAGEEIQALAKMPSSLQSKRSVKRD